MKRSLLLAANELRLAIRDQAEILFALLLPIITFALMYGAFGGTTLFESTARIVDEDGGSYARLFMENLDKLPGIDIETLTAAEAEVKLERSDLLLVTFIPAGFSQALAAGGHTELVFKQRGNGGQEGQILATMVRGVIEDINRDFRVRGTVAKNVSEAGLPAGRIAMVVQQYLDEERAQPAVTVTETLTGSSSGFVNEFVPGIVTMYVLFSLTMSARAIVEEKKRGTLERLLTTRLNVGELFFGKYLASVARGFGQVVILFGLAYAVFQLFTPLDFLASLFITLVFTAAASSLGMVIAAIARTEDGAIWIGVVFTMVMVMMGGTFFPVEPGSVFDMIGKASINTYANDALRMVMAEGNTIGDYIQPLGILVGVAAAGLVVSRFLFKAVPGGK